MKKISLFLTVLILTVGMVACGKKTEEVETKTSTSSTTSVVISTSEEKEEEVKTEESLDANNSSFTYKIPVADIYIDIPEWHEMNKGKTHVASFGDLKYVCVTYNEDLDEAALADKNGYDSVINKLVANMSDFIGSYEIVLENTSETSENGLDLYKYSGAIRCYGVDVDAYATGFTFVMDGVSVNVIGIVTGNDGDSYEAVGASDTKTFNRTEEVAAMSELIESIVGTVRNTK